jgi:hypothetical protein
VSHSQPDSTVTSPSPTTQRSLSAQNSQSGADSPSETVDDIVEGVVAETLLIPHKGICYISVLVTCLLPWASHKIVVCVLHNLKAFLIIACIVQIIFDLNYVWGAFSQEQVFA